MKSTPHQTKIKTYLISIVLILVLIPTLSSIALLNDMLESAISLGINDQIKSLLVQSQQDMKEFRELVPDQENILHNRFNALSDQLLIYDNTRNLVNGLRNTYIVYYIIIILVVLFVTTLAAYFFGKKISDSFEWLLRSDLDKEKRLQQLIYFDEWQSIAGKLAHEIKNSLVPIEVRASSLSTQFQQLSISYQQHFLEESSQVIRQEITKLKDMVEHFSRFARLPTPATKRIDLNHFLVEFVTLYRSNWPAVRIKVDPSNGSEGAKVNIDPLLMNQCFINLINNAVEANPSIDNIAVTIRFTLRSEMVIIEVENSGQSIDPGVLPHIFSMYYSTKSNEGNAGLGLPIVKKILIDHGGDIECVPIRNGARFVMNIPLAG